MQGRAQPAVDQRGLAGARGAHHGQEVSLGQRVHHDIDLLLAAEEQVFLVFAERSQPRVGIHRSVDGRWAHRGAGAVRCDDPHKGIHRLFREAIQAVDQVGLLQRQQEFLIVRGRAREVGVLGEERLVTLTAYLLELVLLVEFPGLVSRPVKQDDAITTHIQLLVGLSDLRGISGEDGERDLEPPAFQKLQQGNDLFPVPLDAEDVNQLAAGFGKVWVGGFRRLGLFQLLQRCVDRAFQLLEVAGDQVRARLHLGILMKRVDECLLGRLPGAGPLGEPDHAWQAAALAAPGRESRSAGRPPISGWRHRVRPRSWCRSDEPRTDIAPRGARPRRRTPLHRSGAVDSAGPDTRSVPAPRAGPPGRLGGRDYTRRDRPWVWGQTRLVRVLSSCGTLALSRARSCAMSRASL